MISSCHIAHSHSIGHARSQRLPAFMPDASQWRAIPLSICALIGLAAASNAEESVRPTDSQVTRLLAEAWKEFPSSIDALVYCKLAPRLRPLNEIRRGVEEVYAATDSVSPYKDSPEKRTRELDAEIDRIAREQLKPILIKKRIRISGHLTREDSVKPQAESDLGPATPFTQTVVNAGNPRSGDFTSFKYAHDQKTATIDDKKGSRWLVSPVIFACALGQGPSALFKMVTAKVPGANDRNGNEPPQQLHPDPTKVASLVDDSHDAVTLLVNRLVYQSHSVDRFEVHLRHNQKTNQPSSHAVMVLFCDAHDYSRLYRSETYDAQTGALLAVTESHEFDESGFPRVWVQERHEPAGSLLRDEYVFADIKVNPKLPKSDFEFAPPEGYVSIDQRPESPVIKQRPFESDQKAVATFTSPKDTGVGDWTRFAVFGTSTFVVVIVCVLLYKHHL